MVSMACFLNKNHENPWKLPSRATADIRANPSESSPKASRSEFLILVDPRIQRSTRTGSRATRLGKWWNKCKKVLDFLVGEADSQKSCLVLTRFLSWSYSEPEWAGQIESFQWIYMDPLSSKLAGEWDRAPSNYHPCRSWSINFSMKPMIWPPAIHRNIPIGSMYGIYMLTFGVYWW